MIGHSPRLPLLCLLTVLVAALAAAQPLRAEISELAVPAGEPITDPSAGIVAEAFALPPAVSLELVSRAVGDSISLPSFPLAPGERHDVELRRVDLYAPDARIRAIDAAGARLVPRSGRLHFLGSTSSDPGHRLGLSLDPHTGNLRGFVDGPAGKFVLSEPDSADRGQHRLTSQAEAARAAGVTEPACGTEEVPLPDSLVDFVVRIGEPKLAQKLLGEPTHSAVIAVDTDNELLFEKFGNDTGAASDWLADLFLEMNVPYERDVSLRLLIGDTFLRPGDPPFTDDPWNVNGSGASGTHLNEFGNYWSANMGSIDRVFAMLLSGKSASGNSASGIAWVDGYCEFQSQGGGYSVTQVFTSNFSSAGIVAHEIGHNAGSPHTHCYTPEVDQCFNAESGCYSGPVSCPNGGPGTVMSYCNFSPPNGAGCGQNSLDFHPTVAALFSTFIDNHSPGCVEETLAAEIFDDGFESGDTTAWSD